MWCLRRAIEQVDGALSGPRTPGGPGRTHQPVAAVQREGGPMNTPTRSPQQLQRPEGQQCCNERPAPEELAKRADNLTDAIRRHLRRVTA